NETGQPLLMVGDGEMFDTMRRRAGPNIRMIRRMSFDELRRAYAAARGLVFTAEEDFGIVLVEAMAAGRPVLAYGRGGARDTVVPGRSGMFFKEQSVASLIEGLSRFERWLPEFDPAATIAHAQAFRPEVFDRAFSDVILA